MRECPSCKVRLLVDPTTKKPHCPINYALVSVLQAWPTHTDSYSGGHTSRNDAVKNAELLSSLKSERTRINNEATEIQSQISQLEQIILSEKVKFAHNLKLKTEIDLRISDLEGTFPGGQAKSVSTSLAADGRQTAGRVFCTCDSFVCGCISNELNTCTIDPFSPLPFDPFSGFSQSLPQLPPKTDSRRVAVPQLPPASRTEDHCLPTPWATRPAAYAEQPRAVSVLHTQEPYDPFALL